MSQALLLIDIQNDYFPGGAMELVGSPQAGERAARLLGAFRGKGLPVIHMQHVAVRPGATFFLPDTPGVQINQCVQPEAGETVLRKHFPNSFRETGLKERLDQLGVQQLFIVGMMTHMCVDTTVRAAADLGYQCLLAHDACATRALTFGERTVPAQEVQASFMAAINGSFAKVLSTEELCAQL